MQHRLRHLVDHAAASGWIHQARNADTLAAGNQQFSERKGHDQPALQLAVARSFGGKSHRWGAVGPEPDRMRRLPFALAHIEMIVARRSSPIDILRGLAGIETAVLPKAL